MNQDRLTQFMDVYEKHLRNDYPYSEYFVSGTLKRTRVAVEQLAVFITMPLFALTFQELGIPHTYEGLKTFLQE